MGITVDLQAQARVERLEREVRAQRNALVNAITNRRQHPTYGYTKASIMERLHILEGMLTALLYMTTWDMPGTPNYADLIGAADACGFDLGALNRLAREA